MLFVATNMIPEFLEFCHKFYGTKITVHDPPKDGEYARFMLGHNIVLIRDHVEDAHDPMTVEVFCSDEKKLEHLTNAWAATIAPAFDEEEKTNE